MQEETQGNEKALKPNPFGILTIKPEIILDLSTLASKEVC